MATYSELVAQKQELARQQAELERMIADQVKEQRASAIAQVNAIMSEFGLSVADLGSGKPGRPAKNTEGATVSKVAAKYRDPATDKTWSGRGLKPRWLSEAIAAGKQISDFAI